MLRFSLLRPIQLSLDQYTSADAAQLRDWLVLRGLAIASVKRNFGSIKAVVNFAVLEQGLTSSNPFNGVYRHSDKPSKKRKAIALDSPKAIQTKCMEVDDDLRHLVSLISDTGVRLSEATGLVTGYLKAHRILHPPMVVFAQIKGYGIIMNRSNASILAISCCTVLSLGGCGGSSNKDVTIPVISLEGAVSVSLEAGTGYTDAGATATDNIDGTITSSIVTVNPVDIDTVGTYTVTYNVSDAAGNAATAVTRTVVIVEPILTGFFTDSAVEGLTYTTDTQSGVTNLNGAFTYQAGETVVFSIGDFMLGESAAATPKMTPLNLIPDAFLPTTRNELSPLLRNKTINTAEVIAFRKLSNMLTFLQALDYDKDASNGITIADGMGIVLEGVSIDFATDLIEFKKAFPLRRMMSTAVTQNLISSGFIKQPGQALNHFYQAQEITHSFKARASTSEDSNVDGDADSITTYTYDADGNQLTESEYTSGDGDADSITTYTYDTDGNQLTESEDTNGDGDADSIKIYTYDADGNQLTRSRDENADDNAIEYRNRTYNSDGNLLGGSEDYDADGTADFIETYTYDANGIMLTGSYCESDDGDFCQTETFTYDADGNRVRESEDTNGDGVANRISTFTYDADGSWLTASYDDDNDGVTDSITTRTYDADGNILTLSYNNITYTYTYDADGNWLTYYFDNHVNGDSYEVYSYTYNTSGNLLTRSDYVVDGNASRILTNTYDADGNQLTSSRNTIGDVDTDFIDTYTYLGSSIAHNIEDLFNIMDELSN